jgi:hypothetical protein
MKIKLTSIDTIAFLFLAAMGLIGLFGEAAILHNDLVHSYPFKMMGMPSFEFYSTIGEVGYYIAVVVGVITIIASIKLPRFLTTMLPVVVCPLAYWLVFEIAHISQGFTFDQMNQRNFGGYTGDTARYEFGFEVLSLVFFGAIIGLVSGLVISKLVTPRANNLP